MKKLFGPRTFVNETMFFPNRDYEFEIVRYLRYAKKYFWIAIYTMTNDKLASTLYSLKNKGVDVRIITDDETLNGNGCDLQNLANAGIPVRRDSDPNARMHHKFMVIDDQILINGSFNWTWTAIKSNNENLVFSSDQTQIKLFKNEFLKLWGRYKGGQLSSNGQVADYLLKYHNQYLKDERYQKSDESFLVLDDGLRPERK